MTDAERARLGHLQTLVAHPGWQEYAAALAVGLSGSLEKATGAGTPDAERGKWAAEYRARKDALEWPEREISALTTKLNQGE